jgi:hypothetical protein
VHYGVDAWVDLLSPGDGNLQHLLGTDLALPDQSRQRCRIVPAIFVETHLPFSFVGITAQRLRLM